MSSADVADTKLVTRGKMVDDMFVSATTYLEGYAQRTGDARPWRTWLPYQEAWRRTVLDSVSFSLNMRNVVYPRYHTLLEEAQFVQTKEEMEQAITSLKGLIQTMPPALPIDFAHRFLDTSKDVSFFNATSNIPELDRHCVFISDSLRLFSVDWSELHAPSIELHEILNNITNFDSIVRFRANVKLALPMIAPINQGLESFVANLNLQE